MTEFIAVRRFRNDGFNTILLKEVTINPGEFNRADEAQKMIQEFLRTEELLKYLGIEEEYDRDSGKPTGKYVPRKK